MSSLGLRLYNHAKLHMISQYNKGLVKINESEKSDGEKDLLMDVHDTKTISELIMLCSAQFAFLKSTGNLPDYYEFCSEIQLDQNKLLGEIE
jgi:hypothetical protein